MTTPAAPAAQATPEAAPATPAPVPSPPAPPKAEATPAAPKTPVQTSILGTEPAPAQPADAGDKAKAEPAAKATEPVPAELKITLPEGAKLDEAILTGLTSESAKLKLTSEQASGLGTFLAAQQKASEEADVAAWTKRSTEWAESVKADKDFGGANFDATVAHAHAAVLKFGGKELAAELRAWGIDNFPPLVKAFARAGKALSEDTSSVEKAGAQGTPSREEQLRREFPSMFNADGSPKY